MQRSAWRLVDAVVWSRLDLADELEHGHRALLAGLYARLPVLPSCPPQALERIGRASEQSQERGAHFNGLAAGLDLELDAVGLSADQTSCRDAVRRPSQPQQVREIAAGCSTWGSS